MALRTIRLFISSPGDVAEERLIARRLIGRLDAQFGGALQFEAYFWERNPLVATASFQEQVVRPSDADVVIVILWSRLGTALPAHFARPDGTTYASGTEFEFEDAVDGFRRTGRPHILAYRKTAAIVPAGDLASLEEAAQQKAALERFVSKWFRNEADGTLKGAFHNFATPADFEDVLEAHLLQLAESFMPPGSTLRPRAATWRGRSPFRGLQAFEPEHAPVFFGRTAATASVLAKLRAQGQGGRAFVLIVSMSGGGKSSLVRAGVLPLLVQRGVVGTATAWRYAVTRPSDGQGRPLAALLRAIADATGNDGEHEIADGAIGQAHDVVVWTQERLRDVAQADGDAEASASCHLALVVDQLEEAFSDERIAAADRDAFFAAIDALARSGSVWVLATMRSDAYARVAESPTLVALKEGDGQFDLLPPGVREIGQIVRLPAAAAGLRFETRPNTAEKLDDVIRDAAARNPGALPLLQFLLEELYQRRNAEDVLTFKAYEELGGVEGALAQHAEHVIAGVGDDARQALSAVLRELVTFGADDESRPLRRVASRFAFTTPAANELVDALLEARLLTSASAADGTPSVSLAHEALLEFWPRLKACVEEDRALLLMHARLEAATREWERSARSGDLLLPRGKPLAEAWEVAEAGIRLSDGEQQLLDASHRRARAFAVARAGAIVALAALTIVAGIAAWKARTESARAQVQATTAQRTTEFMVGLFADADPDQSRGNQVTVREVLDRGVTEIDSGLRQEPSVRANLLRAMGQSYGGLGLFKEARDALEHAVAVSANSDPEDLLKAQWALGETLFDDGEYVKSEELLRRSLELARRLRGASSDEVAVSEAAIAYSLSKQGKNAEAEQRFRHALAIHRTSLPEASLKTADDLNGLGMLLVAERRFGEAEPLVTESLAIRKSLLGPQHGKVALTLGNLALLYFQIGNYDRARAMWAEALPINKSVYGNDHTLTAANLNNLGRVELLTAELTSAKAHMQEALRIFRKALSPDHDDFVPVLNSLAMISLEQNDLAGARPLLEEALKIARARHHPFLDQVLGNAAELDVRDGRVDEGVQRLAEARTALTARYGDALNGSEAWRAAILDITQAEIELRGSHVTAGDRLLSTSLTVLSARFGPRNIYVRRIERAREAARR